MRSTAAVMAMLVLLAGCAFVSVDLRPPTPALEEKVVEGSGRAKIALVEVSGLLSLDRVGLDRFSQGPPPVARLKEELERAAADEKVVGLLVRIDSPGGSVTASDLLYHELLRFRREKKVPVVACIMDKALSGGYYAALAADEIFAHPTSVVGGVGVIAWRFDFSGLLARWGIEAATVQSAPLKDFWSPLRPGHPEEIAIMQEVVDSLHGRFLHLLQQHRPVPADQLASVASGRIFGAETALGLGLVDRLGYLDDALAQIRRRAGVETARVVVYSRPGHAAETIYSGSAPLLRELSTLEQAANELLMPSFRYQYLE